VSGKIVVGIDGSQSSFASLRYALDLGQRTRSEVAAVFVVDTRKTDLPIIYTASHFDYGFERVYIPPEPGLKDFYARIKEDLSAFGEKCLAQCRAEAESMGVPIATALKEGLPSHALSEEARAGDFLAIGQKGEHAHFDRAIVGSTTEDIVRSSPRPVLVCPETFRSPRRLLFPYDGSPLAERALQFCVNEFPGIWEEMVVLAVQEPEEDERTMDTELKYLHAHDIPYRVLVEKGNAIDAITRSAEREKADMILIGSRGRNKIRDYLLGSTAAHLIRRSRIPVLVVF
jgi:nucleotide-binding universal stress UspA family protein